MSFLGSLQNGDFPAGFPAKPPTTAFVLPFFGGFPAQNDQPRQELPFPSIVRVTRAAGE